MMAMVVGMMAGPALAGEITGKGKSTAAPANANSICAFSGLDDPDADSFGRTQSFGQFVRMGEKDAHPSPGQACRG